MNLIHLAHNVSFLSFSFLFFFLLDHLSIFIGVSYFSVGALTSGAIVYLYTTPLLVFTIPHVGLLVSSVLIAAILLSHSYNEISSQQSSRLLSNRFLIFI